MPNLFILAGPNGAGKSTSASELLSGVRKVAEFVNADVIQKDAGVSEIEAGRITLARLNALAEARKDMAFETTLASQMLLPRIRRMKDAGYWFHLFSFGFPVPIWRFSASPLAWQAADTTSRRKLFDDVTSAVSKLLQSLLAGGGYLGIGQQYRPLRQKDRGTRSWRATDRDG